MDPADSSEAGQRFVVRLIAGLIGLMVLYAALHLTNVGPEVTREDLASLSETGNLEVVDSLGLSWWAGQKAIVVATRMEQREREIASRIATIRSTLTGGLRFATSTASVDRGTPDAAVTVPFPTGTIQQSLAAGDFQGATAELRRFEETIAAPTTVHDPRIRNVLNMLYGQLAEVEALIMQQRSDFEALAPPSFRALFFWTSPRLSIVEVLFFALFGVLTNLLVNSAEYLRRGEFNPSERWVAYTKLVYGPVLAAILTVAIVLGWFDLGDYSTRAYSLPLIGFIFGYASRRVVTIFDEFVSRILGQASKSILEGPGATARRARQAWDAMSRTMEANSREDLRSKAKVLAQGYLKVSALERGARS